MSLSNGFNPYSSGFSIYLFIEKGKHSDNKYIPNFIEEPVQDITEDVFKLVRDKFDLKALIEDIVAQGKKESGKM